MTQAQPLIQTLPMTLGAPMSDDPSNPSAIEIPLQIELPNGQTLFAAVALGGLPFDGQRQIAERIAAAWNAFTGVTTEEIKAPVKCLHQIAEPSAQTPEDAQIQALMRKHRIWIEHSTLFENDEPERELRAVQAEEHQFNAFVQDLIAATQLAAAPQAVQPVAPQLKANCYSDDNGDYWRDCPDDCDFVEGLKVGDTYELQASIRAWSETFRVTKAPDETSDDYEVELVSSDAPAHPAEGVPAQALVDGGTPGPWRVRKRTNDSGEVMDCFVTAPDCQGRAYDAHILGDDYDKAALKLADAELIVAAVNAYRATQPAAQGLDAVMVNMTPPATSRDRWMYEQGRLAEREIICAAIKAEDDHCVDQGDYMLDSEDCIKIVRGEWTRPEFMVDAAQAKQGGAA